MLSDVLIPMLDLDDTADPIEDYLAALRLLESAAGRPASDPLANTHSRAHGMSGKRTSPRKRFRPWIRVS
jgi:hypothetical protein